MQRLEPQVNLMIVYKYLWILSKTPWIQIRKMRIPRTYLFILISIYSAGMRKAWNKQAGVNLN